MTKNNYQFTAHIERDSETGYYVAYVPNLPGAHTQAETLDELHENLKDVVELVIESLDEEKITHLQNQFVGTQEVRVTL